MALPPFPPQEGDVIIAADGGLRHTQALGLTPDVILGDFDSLGYVPDCASVFPVEKDDTDAMLAIRRGLSMGCREFLLYGALDGDRLDHTLANIQALHFLVKEHCTGYLVGDRNIITVLPAGQTLVFPETANGIVSAFCFGAPAKGVCLEGLQYPLENGVLTSDFPLGVSNHFQGRQAKIALASGCLTLLWDRSCGFPQRLF
jgi:thiamine pyrophosphokinase